MKYLATVKFRLVDRGIYVSEGEVFDPEDRSYESSSKSLAAALRAGWLKIISEDEANQLEVERIKKLTKIEPVAEVKKAHVDPNQPKAISRKINKDVEVATPNVGLGEVTDEDMADEVIHQGPIIAAMEKRRTAQSQRQESKVQVADVKKDASSIRDEINSKVRKSLRINKRKSK